MTSRVSLSESPQWNQTLEFNVEQGQDSLYIRLYECRPDVPGSKVAGRCCCALAP